MTDDHATTTGGKAITSACSRCGGDAERDGRWENGWPNYGRIQIGLDSRGQMELPWGWNPHPALEAGSLQTAQELVIEWGNGYRFDSQGRYRLCRDCQRALWRVIGAYFAPSIPAPPPPPPVPEDVQRVDVEALIASVEAAAVETVGPVCGKAHAEFAVSAIRAYFTTRAPKEKTSDG